MSVGSKMARYLKMGGGLQAAAFVPAVGGAGYAVAKQRDDGGLSRTDSAIAHGAGFAGLGLSTAGLMDILENAPRSELNDILGRKGRVTWSSPETLKSQEKVRFSKAVDSATKDNVISLSKFKKSKNELSALSKVLGPNTIDMKMNFKRAGLLGAGGLALGAGIGALLGKKEKNK